MNLFKYEMGRYVTILAFIGIVDMLVTATCLEMGWCGEANPTLDYAWTNYGLFGFMALKSLFIFVTSLIFTWVRMHQKDTADRYARVAIGLYLFIFGIGLLAQI